MSQIILAKELLTALICINPEEIMLPMPRHVEHPSVGMPRTLPHPYFSGGALP